MGSTLRRLLTAWTDRHPYTASLGLVATATLLGLISVAVLHLGPANIETVYLFAVLLSALRWGRDPSIVTALFSTLAFDSCFIPPTFTFGVGDLPYAINLFGFLVVAMATSTLAARSRALTIEQTARARAEARTRAKDEILRSISHEFRSPLNALLGWAQMLDRPDMEVGRFSRATRGVRESARLLGWLIDDLLSARRMTVGKFSVDLRTVDLASIVSVAVDVAALGAQANGVHLDFAIEQVGTILAEEPRIEQIVTNLLSNAIKFTPTGGRISVQPVRVGGHASLTVRDTGNGIATAFLPQVFEPFAQGDAAHATRGLGLGLSIVKYLVDAHGGKITVASPGLGSGTTFSVLLHLPDPAPPESASRTSSALGA